MSNKEKAVAYFKDGFNCSQSILATFASQYNLDIELALRVSTGFGGGIGSQGETCGAVSGAVMVIGLEHGKVKADDKIAKAKTYKLVQEFSQRFNQKFGSTKCKDLLGCDLSTEEGNKIAREKGLFKTICPVLIQQGVEILEEILKENN